MDPDDRANMAKQHLAYIAMPLDALQELLGFLQSGTMAYSYVLNGLRQMLLNRLKETVHRFLASPDLSMCRIHPFFINGNNGF